jgi:hypothetical protein
MLQPGKTPKTSNIMWNFNSFRTTYLSRGTVTEQEARDGKFMKTIVTGDGNEIDVTNKAGQLVSTATDKEVVLRKRIFNVKLNSAVAIANPVNKATLAIAMEADKLGNSYDANRKFVGIKDKVQAQKAADYYNQYLNDVQVSFSLLAGHKLYDRLKSNSRIECDLELIETEDGKLITINSKGIALQGAEAAAKTTSTMLDDFFGTEEAPATVKASELDALTA